MLDFLPENSQYLEEKRIESNWLVLKKTFKLELLWLSFLVFCAYLVKLMY